MTRKSHDTLHQISTVYMSGMGEQISEHFDLVIQLRFNQIFGLAAVVPPDGRDRGEFMKTVLTGEGQKFQLSCFLFQ